MDAALAHLPPGCPTVVTGNPVREGFTRTMVCADEPDGQIIHHRNLPAAGRRRLVVLGGTTGAASFDEHVPLALSQLLQMHADAPTWDVIHQSRQDGVARTRERYRVAGLNAAVVAWISDLPDVLRRADLVICRAGGTTLAELAVCGVPAIVVPYPHAAADHQRCNAEVFQAAGACRVVEEETFRGTLTDRLRNELENLGHDDDVRREMSRAMSQLARPEAAWAVADVIRGIVCPNVCLASE
jgi:UDP-N-acetylglucosamine--N-acetylmuramyl-(pentapeptide) pyrophosphoryl-undecaprenol N-acetylglucosamine transferase